ncbi:UNVERIFIED_CONTAM: UTP--glucose-1-phosphate uridylyltransferase, partial [Bifidobacterium breve]
MREKGMSETAINQFQHLYSVWQHEEASNWIREDDVEPLEQVPSFNDVYETINHDKAVDAFAKTAFLKLNGGLGTFMGLECAKSLLPVRRHKARQMRFIDIIIGQMLTARTRLNVELPLTFMNSFRTS